MTSLTDMTERHSRLLADLAERGHALACALQEDALASDDKAERVSLAAGFHQVARTVRQSIALEAKLRRDLDRDDREIAHTARIKEILHPNGEGPPPRKRLFPRDIPAANERAGEIRTGMQRLLWSEGFEKSDYDCEQELEGHFFRCLEDFLAEDRLKDDFTTRDLDDQIAEYAHAFGLNPDNIPRWRDLPDPDPEDVAAFLADDSDDGEHPKWRSSG